MNDLHEIKQKTQQDYSAISQLYIADFGSNHTHFELIDKLIGIIRERRLLLRPTIDLGSGPGTIVDYLIKKGLWKVIAVDITPEFCDYMREKFKNLEGAFVDILEGDMVELMQKELQGWRGYTAAITAGFSIIHIPDNEVDGLLKNIYDLLFAGGVFYMSCHEGTSKGMELEPYTNQKDKRFKTHERFEVYMNYFTKEELRTRIEKVGFEIIDLIRYEPDILPGEIPVAKLQVLAQKPLK